METHSRPISSDALIAVWDGKSPGTKGMISVAEKRGIKVHVSII